MSTEGTQQDLVNLLYICRFRQVLWRLSFASSRLSFSEIEREESTYHRAFSNEMRIPLSYWRSSFFSPQKHFSTLSFKDHQPQVLQTLKLLGSPLSIPSRRHPLTTKTFSISCCKVTHLKYSSTRCQQVLNSRSGCLLSHYFHQVVHIRGHIFSKRFIPAGVYSSTRTNQLLAPPGSRNREVPTKRIDSRL